jgi:hypothetical protein
MALDLLIQCAPLFSGDGSVPYHGPVAPANRRNSNFAGGFFNIASF